MSQQPTPPLLSESQFDAISKQISQDICKVLNQHIVNLSASAISEQQRTAYLLAVATGLAKSFASYVRVREHRMLYQQGKADLAAAGGVPLGFDSEAANAVYGKMINALFNPLEDIGETKP